MKSHVGVQDKFFDSVDLELQLKAVEPCDRTRRHVMTMLFDASLAVNVSTVVVFVSSRQH